MRELADERRVAQLMLQLGPQAEQDTRIYFAGGATAVLYGWRATTRDVDVKIVPDADRVLRAIAALKEELHMNIELAAPDDFIPVSEQWQERSPFIKQVGRTFFYHFDLDAQALAKIERGHHQDTEDVRAMLERGLVSRQSIQDYFNQIEPRIYRYPALDLPSFRAAVASAVRGPDPRLER